MFCGKVHESDTLGFGALCLVLLELSEHRSKQRNKSLNSNNAETNHQRRRHRIHSVQKPLDGLECLQLGDFKVQHGKVLARFSCSCLWEYASENSISLCNGFLSQQVIPSAPQGGIWRHVPGRWLSLIVKRLLDSDFQHRNLREGGGGEPSGMSFSKHSWEVCSPLSVHVEVESG